MARQRNGNFVIRDSRGYISLYDYKAIRETLHRARTWVSLKNVERYLQTDSFRRLAIHTDSDMEICELLGPPGTHPTLVRIIPQAEVQAAAAQASTRAERRARGLLR